MAISINFTKTVDNAVDLSQKKTYIKGAFTSASDIANFPTAGIATGSELVNVGGGNDTGKKYVFTGTEWILAPSGSGGSERTVVPVTFEWNEDSQPQQYSPANVPVDVYNHPEKYDLLCTFSGGEYDFTTTMFRYGANYNIPFYFGIMGYEEPYNFAVSISAPDVGAEVTHAFFVGKNDDKFIVTLTPTAQDYSGTMDKTVAEINTAYKAGQQIRFKLVTGSDTYMLVDVTATWNRPDYIYPSFNAYIVDDSHNMIIYGFTSTTDDGTKATYGTTLYSLTRV